MAYLSKDDYTISISIDHLDQILAQAASTSGLTVDQIRVNSEETAQAEINAYLAANYNTPDEFLIAVPADRNKLILRCYVNLSLYNIFVTISPRDLPENRLRMYNDCIDMLKAYRDGLLDFGLPVIDIDADGEADIQRTVLMSGSKFISKPFTDLNLL